MKIHCNIRSTIVKTMIVEGVETHRHFFEWYERPDLSPFYLRLTLIRLDGTVIGNTHNIKFPKVKLLGTVMTETNGVVVEMPHYNVPRFFYVDSNEIAGGFEYFTATLTRKSPPRIDTISKKREDLRFAEQKP